MLSLYPTAVNALSTSRWHDGRFARYIEVVECLFLGLLGGGLLLSGGLLLGSCLLLGGGLLLGGSLLLGCLMYCAIDKRYE